jgi:predicted ATPase/class 3 adenylate cyclase
MDAQSTQRAFLFTDIEGSTRLWEQRPDAMPRALAEHDRLIRSAVETSHGRVFKTVGDAICADFPTAGDALAAAVAAQLAIESFLWHALDLDAPLRVRMAIHQGRVGESSGELAGPVLNRLARLLAAGHGGQILIAGTAADALDQSSIAGLELRSLGERRLRDVAGAERILHVVVPGLQEVFPPIRTLDPVAHNLPVAPTACLGREPERQRIRTFFGPTGTRLVTLIGPGGIGKTRLAIEAAYDLLDEQPHGVWFVDLSAIRGDDQVAGVVMRALDVPEESNEPVEESLVRWFSGKQLLLVVDNCEQVVEEVARLIARVLRGSGGVRVLATSRVALEIRGEQRLPVEPLALPEERSAGIDGVAESPAVQLFVERASAAEPSFSLDLGNGPDVADICRRVDGIPLAIELAAARIAVLGPAELRRALEERLPSLTGGARDLPDRHRTLRDAIRWSYELLAARDRQVFDQLAVFAGGWSLDAAERVVGGEAAEVLVSLTAHSLVRSDGLDGNEHRYIMLETIREFAQEQLTDFGCPDGPRRRHADYFIDLAEQASPLLAGGERQALWMQTIGREYANLLEARMWLRSRGDGDAMLRMGADIWNYWLLTGSHHDGESWLRDALDLTSQSVTPVRARALRKLGNMKIEGGDTGAALRLYEESLELETTMGNAEGIAEAKGSLGMVAQMQGRYDEYRPLLEESAAIWRKLGNLRGEAIALFNLAIGSREEGKAEGCREDLRTIRQMQEALQDHRGIAYSSLLLAQVELDCGHVDLADRLLTSATAEFQSGGDSAGLARASLVSAEIALHRLDVQDARDLLTEVLSVFEEQRDLAGCAEAKEGLAEVAMLRGDPASARRYLQEADDHRRQCGWVLPLCRREKVAEMRARLARESNQNTLSVPHETEVIERQ